ncbi:tripartite tricarboxylate transporter TctB family protein [Chachezhania antarctica]|uniref:tripartite tricarboxylate transporter TctB family protein n=1 Tax=Chachezhania antarctica TaxID=2340860 RepID=UPI000EAB603A|nr:tripartite tricarboxylate transporter TctB family protein [Chachezhania antarctica]|tara:strand:- start:399 stop:863 length:465 start_codon:yes stop_codon:yes gene_type:complete
MTSVKSLLPGATLFVFALAMAVIAAGYPLGSLLRPGPGFFPLVIAILLAGLALATMVEDWRRDGGPVPPDDEGADAGRVSMRPVIATSAAIIVFALLLERLGFVPAALALVAIAALGEPRRNWLTVALVGVFMSAFGIVLFIWLLGLPIEPFGA